MLNLTEKQAKEIAKALKRDSKALARIIADAILALRRERRWPKEKTPLTKQHWKVRMAVRQFSGEGA